MEFTKATGLENVSLSSGPVLSSVHLFSNVFAYCFLDSRNLDPQCLKLR